jgi:serum/glucocorticoid-regulated kinase 2
MQRPYVGANRKEIREKMLAKQVQLDEIPPYGWSRESVEFINKLIQRRPEERLGYKGIEEVKYHPFFKKMDW